MTGGFATGAARGSDCSTWPRLNRTHGWPSTSFRSLVWSTWEMSLIAVYTARLGAPDIHRFSLFLSAASARIVEATVTFEVKLRDGTIERVEHADPYHPDGQLITFRIRGRAECH